MTLWEVQLGGMAASAYILRRSAKVVPFRTVGDWACAAVLLVVWAIPLYHFGVGIVHGARLRWGRGRP